MGKKLKIDPLGYKNPANKGNPVIIPDNRITMQGITDPVLGISDEGDIKLMKPNKNYKFKGSSVLEMPVLSKGGKMKKRKKAQSGISVPKIFQKADEEINHNFALDNAQMATLDNPRRSFAPMDKALGLVPQYLTDDLNVNMNPIAKSKQKPDVGAMLQAGLYGVSTFMPSEKPRRQYVRPEDQDYYNPYGNGTGSQAIMQSGGVMYSPFSSSVPRSRTQEATRQGSMVVDPITQKLLDDKAHEQKKIQQFMQANPNLDLQAYTEQRRQQLGTINKDGDFIPNELYNKPGRTQGNISSPTDMIVSNFAKKKGGGKMTSSYEDGGNMVLYNSNTSAEPISDNPFHSEMIEFKGPSHEDDGIPMAFGEQKVEVEGEETAFMDVEGNMQILGNMKNPLTGRLFKNDGKMIAKKENRATKQYQKGLSSIEENPISNLFDKISAKSSELKMKGASMKLGELAKEREMIARIQEEKLAMAEALGVEPMKLDKMTKGGKLKFRVDMETGGKLEPGGKMFAQSGATVANRHNNPGNIKITPTNRTWLEKYGAVQGERATDGGYFAKFPDPDKGKLAMRELLTQRGPKTGYKNMKVEEALDVWTNHHPYQMDLGVLKGKKIGDLSGEELDGLVNYIAKGEGFKYGPKTPTGKTKKTTPSASVTPPAVQDSPIPDLQPTPTYVPKLKKLTPEMPEYVKGNSTPPAAPSITSTYNPIPNRESDAEPLNPFGLTGELFTLATDRRQPVKMQKYNPMLEQDFEMSLEDQRQSVKDAFRTAMLQNRSNPSIQASLAGQMAEQLRSVDAQEFRINQENTARVYNANRNTLNDAQWKNLGLGDQQYVRQEQADSTTRLNRFNAFNSISSKYLQKERDNNELKVYENLYNYRYNPEYQVENQNVAPNWSNKGNGEYTPITETPKNNTAKAVANANGVLYPTPPPRFTQWKDMSDPLKISSALEYKGKGYKKQKSGGKLVREFKEYKG